MTEDDIADLIKGGEGMTVEFKESVNALSKDVFDSVCAFNNRLGGDILIKYSIALTMEISISQTMPIG